MAVPSHSGLRAAYAALFYLGLVSIVAGAILSAETGDDFSIWTLVAPGIVALVAAAVSMAVLLHRAWRVIETNARRFDARRKTLDPGAAVALTMVPIINVIGIFFTLVRLPGQLNWLANAAKVPKRVPEELGFIVGLSAALSYIPLLGILARIVLVCVLPPLVLLSSTVAESIDRRLESYELAAPGAAATERPPLP